MELNLILRLKFCHSGVHRVGGVSLSFYVEGVVHSSDTAAL